MSAIGEVCVLPSDKSKILIDTVSKEEGFVDYKIEVSTASTKGDNYLGEVYRVRITENKRKSNGNNDLTLILKISPSSEAIRQFLPINTMFKRELFAYEIILPALNGLQKESKIPYDDRFNSARYFKGCREELKEMIIMEDLGAKGFKMYDRLKPIDYDHAVLAIRKLAVFHATSFVLKKREPEKFVNMVSNLYNALDFGVEFPKALQDTADYTVELMDDQECADKLKAFAVDIYAKLEKSVSIGEVEPHAVLCHGDSWSNNFIFKYEDNKPTDMVMLDWQLMRHASPITDLAFFIFTGTEEDFRREHLSQILDLYYETLSRSINEMGQKAELLFPEKIFRAHVEKYLIYGLIMTILAIPYTLSERGDTPDVIVPSGDENKPAPPAKVSEQGLKRLRGVVRDFVNYKMI